MLRIGFTLSLLEADDRYTVIQKEAKTKVWSYERILTKLGRHAVIVKDTAADAGTATTSTQKHEQHAHDRSKFQRQRPRKRRKRGKRRRFRKTIRNGTNHYSAGTAEKGQSKAHVS
jgi:Ni/Co efflux regulator RcnB